MTEGQYRALVAYLNFWTPQYKDLNIDAAMRDIGISASKQDVIHSLFKAGWNYDAETGLIHYEGDA